MGATDRRGLLAQALDRGMVELVRINEVKFLPFAQRAPGYPVSLGVRGLSACSVVIVVSEHGAIVAHIGPDVPGATATDSFIRLASSKMDQLVTLYQQHRNYFVAPNNAYIIYATFQDRPTSPEKTTIIRQRLRELDLSIVKDCSYERSAASLIDGSGPEGTVWVIKRHGSSPAVFLEDQIITPSLEIASTRSSSSLSSRRTTSQASRSQVTSPPRIISRAIPSYSSSTYNVAVTKTSLAGTVGNPSPYSSPGG
nr:hypothetical protein CFP56_09872 [Quercus suber]